MSVASVKYSDVKMDENTLAFRIRKTLEESSRELAL
jgi:hypothetical protein